MGAHLKRLVAARSEPAVIQEARLRTRHTEKFRIDSPWRMRELNSRGTSESSDLPWLPAAVPGHVHLDLFRAGVIDDPFYRMNERGVAWVDQVDWVYETTFHLDEPPPDGAYLLFRGLDTIAEVRLNGDLLGETDNMFVPHEFHVGERLRSGEGEPGKNTLHVVFRSAMQVGAERQNAWNEAGFATMKAHWSMWGPRSFVRKAQYMYGWDWGPELVSCGIWKPVELVLAPVARLQDWKYTVQFAEDGSAIVRVQVFVERSAGSREVALILTAALLEPEESLETANEAGSAVTMSSVAVPEDADRTPVLLTLTVPQPKKWWPNGHGSPDEPGPFLPYLYHLDLALHSRDRLDFRRSRVGLRTVELVQEADEDGQGESFKFRVNGRDLFIKGANWIPADSFPSRLDTDPWDDRDNRVRDLIEAAARAHFNMLRVWGGGLYESEEFYGLCDELGILVWQDFPYGCAYYPDEAEYATAGRREAIAAVRRLRVHPSLALWCGNNENDQMHHQGWGGPEYRPPRYLGEKLYHHVLPAVVEAEDSGRPYWPSSPYGGEDPNSPDRGDRHDWDVWHGVGDWTNYRTDRSRFCSEFGFASSCGLAAWDKYLAPPDRWPDSPAVQWHDKTRKGYETYLGFIRIHFPDPRTLEDLVYYSQLNQAEALKCGLEHWRRIKGRCWGLLFWQLNDCWPVQSWAVIDSEGERKAAYYAVGRAYEPVLLSLLQTGDFVEAHVTNDLPSAATGALTLQIRTFDGEVLSREQETIEVGDNGAARVGQISLEAAKGRENGVFVEAELVLPDRTCRNLLFLAEPKDLALADPGLSVTLEDADEDHFVINVEARRLAPYVWLRIRDRDAWTGGAEWSDNFFHLRPGAYERIALHKTPTLQTLEDLRSRLVIRAL